MLNISQFRKRYKIESSNQQKTIIKSHMDLPKKLKYLTFADPEKSRSQTKICDAENLVNVTR